MRQHSHGHPIRVQTDHEGQPTAFRWRGAVQRIASIEDIREPALDWWSSSGEIRRRYYLVTTTQGIICEIYQESKTQTWFLARLYD